MTVYKNESERMVKEIAENTFIFMNEYKEKGFEAVSAYLTEACLTSPEKEKLQLIQLSRMNTWDITALPKVRALQLENSTLFAATFNTVERHTDEEIAHFMMQFDFEKVDSDLIKKLEELKFDFDTYKEYLLKLDNLLNALAESDLKAKTHLKC